MAAPRVRQNPQAVPIEERLRVPEVVRAVGYAALLVWLNAYICREMFVRYTPHMNSMQGFWIAMARAGFTPNGGAIGIADRRSNSSTRLWCPP